MEIILILLILPCCSTAKKMLHNCTEILPLPGIIHTSDKRNETFLSTVYPQMLVGQTICYDVLVEDEGKKVRSGRLAFISLIDVVQEYEIKLMYNFSVPAMKVECDCICHRQASCKYHYYFDDEDDEDCHGQDETGSGHWGETKGNSHLCIKQYVTLLNSTACAPLLAEMCCTISLSHKPASPDYMAVFVANPVTIFHIEMGFAGSDGKLITNLVQTSLSSAVETKTPIGQVRIEEHLVEQSMPSSKWYFMGSTNRVLYTGVPINDLRERSISKLGWYKFNDDGKLLPIDWNGLKHSLNISVRECVKNSVLWKTNASVSEDMKHFPVKDLLNTTVEVNGDGKGVKVGVNLDAPVLLESKFKVSAKVLFQYGEVTMDKFRAEIIVNPLSSHGLLLFMHAASGWFFVTVDCKGFSREKHIVFVTSEVPIDTFKNVTLSAKCPCSSEVCIYRNGRKIKFKQCVSATCPERQTDSMSKTTVIIVGAGAALFTIVILTIVFCCLRKKGYCKFGPANTVKPQVEGSEQETEVVLIDLYQDTATPPPAKNADRDSAPDHLYDELVYDTKLAQERLLTDPQQDGANPPQDYRTPKT